MYPTSSEVLLWTPTYLLAPWTTGLYTAVLRNNVDIFPSYGHRVRSCRGYKNSSLAVTKIPGVTNILTPGSHVIFIRHKSDFFTRKMSHIKHIARFSWSLLAIVVHKIADSGRTKDLHYILFYFNQPLIPEKEPYNHILMLYPLPWFYCALLHDMVMFHFMMR